MNKKLIPIFFFLFLFVQYSHAFECSLTSDPEYCSSIINSEINETEKDLVLSSLLYQHTSYPNHTFVENYNLQLNVTEPPNNTEIYNSIQIKNAWLSFLAIFPSVYENNILYVSENTKLLSEYNYTAEIPENYEAESYPENSEGNCKRIYKLTKNEKKLNYFLNGNPIGEGKFAEVNINSNGTIKSELTIDTEIEVKHYKWKRYCAATRRGRCIRYEYRCEYTNTEYPKDNLKILEEKQIQLYTLTPSSHLEVARVYNNITEARFRAENYAFASLKFNSSYINYQNYAYNLVFDKKPYYFAYLEAKNFSHISYRNLYLSNNTLFVKNTDNCEIWSYNHFHNFSSECDLTPNGEELEDFKLLEEKNVDLDLVIYVIIFLLVVYICYRVARSQLRKVVFVLIILLLLLIPNAFAVDPPPPEEPEENCGLTNLASCLPEKIYDYFLVLINAPLIPLLGLIQLLLTADISIDIFHGVWSVIRYILSFFYVFLFLYAGFIFITSSSNPIRRTQAKEIIKDTFIMIILIQGSFYIYDMVLGLNSILSNSILTMIEPEFFLITVDNIVNVGLELFFSVAYAITLFLTVLLLIMRYIVVSLGVVFFPIGIFCYFVPPLRSYGRFIIHLLGVFIFVTFFDLLIILACSMIIEAPIFASIKILVMIACFSIVNYTLWKTIKLVFGKAVDNAGDKLSDAIKYVAMAV